MTTQKDPPDSNVSDNAVSEEPSMVAEDDYFLEIESRFAELRGTPFVFSARDWALMKSWRDEGIPLPVVIEAMNDCFEKRMNAPRRRIISSLSYCRHAVRELWDERKNLHVGGESSLPEAGVAGRLAELGETLDAVAVQADETSLRECLERASADIRSISISGSVSAIEESLMAIEEGLLTSAEAALPAAMLGTIQEDLDRELAAYTFTDEETRERTRRANFRRRLRKELSIPRLSLFG